MLKLKYKFSSQNNSSESIQTPQNTVQQVEVQQQTLQPILQVDNQINDTYVKMKKSVNFNNIHIKVPILPSTVKNCDIKEKKYKSTVICITNTYVDDLLFDWIYWHKCIIGFDKVVIADNRSDMCIKRMCDMFENVEYYDARLYKKQCDFYNDYLTKYNNSEWVLVIDDDELLYVPSVYDNKINNYIDNANINKYSKVAFQWKLMYSDKLYETRNIDFIEFSQYCNPIETELELSNGMWCSGWVKTMLHTTNNTLHYFSDDNAKFMYPTIDELIKSDMLYEDVNEFNTSINRNNVIAPLCNDIVLDAIGTVHNPITLRNNKYSIAYNAYDDKYLFGINTEPMHMVKSTVPTVLHYKYRSKSEYCRKINYPRFDDISKDYYAKNFNLNTIEERYRFNKYFIKFSEPNDLYSVYKEDKWKKFNKFHEMMRKMQAVSNVTYENDTVHPNKKYSVVTAIFGNYDILRQPLIIDPDCEYICITDNLNLLLTNNTSWKVIVTNDINVLRIDDPRQKTYYVRYHMFDFCNTEYAIWLDASMEIGKPLQPFIKQLEYSGYDIGLEVYTHVFDTMDKNLGLWHNVSAEYFDPIIEKTRKWLTKINYDMNYKGLFVATIRVCKNTELNRQLDNDVYALLKEMGDNYYFDEIIFSVIANTKYSNILKVYPIHGDITCSDYIFAHEHGSTKTRYRTKSEMLIYNNNRAPLFLFNQQILPHKV